MMHSLILSLLSVLFAVIIMSSQDCLVMEKWLQDQGHKVRVESGQIETQGKETRAILECRTDSNRVAFTWDFPLGEFSAHP